MIRLHDRECSPPPIPPPAGRGGGGGGLVLIFLILFLLFPLPAHARIRTVLILASGYTFTDLKRDAKMDILRALSKQGGAALVKPVRNSDPSEPGAYLSVGAGIPIYCPRKTGPRFYEGGVERAVADLAADIFPAQGREGELVSRAYRRRVGDYPPLRAIAVHVSLPALLRAQQSQEQRVRIAGLGEALRKAGIRVGVYGDWKAGLVGMDGRGVVLEGDLHQLSLNQFRRMIREHDLVIISAEDLLNLRVYVRVAMEEIQQQPTNVIVASVAPPLWDSKWTGYGFAVAVGPGFNAGTQLTSDSTHIPGVISCLDIAPTLLSLLEVKEPFGGSGHLLRTVPAGKQLTDLAQRSLQLLVSNRARGPSLALLGFLAALSPLIALIGITLSLRVPTIVGRIGMYSAAASPLAFLAVATTAPSTPFEYTVMTLGYSILAGVLAGLIGRGRRYISLAIPLVLSVFVILGDAVTGGYVSHRSILAGQTFWTLAILAATGFFYMQIERTVEEEPAINTRKKGNGAVTPA